VKPVLTVAATSSAVGAATLPTHAEDDTTVAGSGGTLVRDVFVEGS
jgi:hypothetical protein